MLAVTDEGAGVRVRRDEQNEQEERQAQQAREQAWPITVDHEVRGLAGEATSPHLLGVVALCHHLTCADGVHPLSTPEAVCGHVGGVLMLGQQCLEVAACGPELLRRRALTLVGRILVEV